MMWHDLIQWPNIHDLNFWHMINILTIFPRHQIWRLSYNFVTPLDGHSSRPKDHIRKAKALSECSCSKEHRDIKIFDTSHDTFLTYVGLKFTVVSHFYLCYVFFDQKSNCVGSALNHHVYPSSYTPPSK